RRRDGLPRPPAAREHEQRQLPPPGGRRRGARGAAPRPVTPPPPHPSAVLEPFANEPLAELRRAEVRTAYGEALAELDSRGPATLHSLIDGQPIDGPKVVRSTDPGQPSRTVAEHAPASPADVPRALAAARRAA